VVGRKDLKEVAYCQHLSLTRKRHFGRSERSPKKGLLASCHLTQGVSTRVTLLLLVFSHNPVVQLNSKTKQWQRGFLLFEEGREGKRTEVVVHEEARAVAAHEIHPIAHHRCRGPVTIGQHRGRR
jgi:hypothetical protein